MSKNKLQITRAEDYAGLKSTDERPSELVEMPSGAVFRLRRADIQGMAIMGELPQSLVNAGLKEWQKRGTAPATDGEIEKPEDISPEDTVGRLILMRQTVVENCLEPRLGFDPMGVVSLLDSQGQRIAKLQLADFLYAFNWIIYREGVAPGDGLDRFRNRHERRTAASGSNRKKLRRAPVAAS